MCEKSDKRGSISFFATYRPPVALDIYSVSMKSPLSSEKEVCITDEQFYNYNGKDIPKNALKNMLNHPKMASESGANSKDVDSGRLSSGLLFVSERDDGLETLYIAFRFNDNKVKVVNFAKVYKTFDDGGRLEDHGCFTDKHIIYVSTKDDPVKPHQPWNAVFQTNLSTGETKRLTPKGAADFSPSISPNGSKLAVASFEEKNGGWCGESEDLETNIFVIDLVNPSKRTMVVKDGGWPSWGSDSVLFFHRNIEKVDKIKRWGVFRINIDDKGPEGEVIRVTPEDINAITPAAIDATTVAVATIRKHSIFGDVRSEEQYRHIEVFELSNKKEPSKKITQSIRSLADHFNPFVIVGNGGEKHIGYHRCKVTDKREEYAVVQTKSQKIKCDEPDIGVFRVSGVFLTISPNGEKLAFVDNEFRGLWLADKDGLRLIFELEANSMFSPAWNQNPANDLLYICKGPAFRTAQPLKIYSIHNPGIGTNRRKQLTNLTMESNKGNNAFPSTNPEGTKLVFRSNRDGPKNLYIMDALRGERAGKPVRLTNGDWTDTQCQWSPKNNWIVFSSNRSNPNSVKKPDLLDPGYFAVYMVQEDHPESVIHVIDSGYDLTKPDLNRLFPGHVNHPYFSPDGKTLVVAADFAAVSCEPISLPFFSHSVRPYGDLFLVELDIDKFENNKDLKKFKRLTHSRYGNSSAVWSKYSIDNTSAKWNHYIGDKTSTSTSTSTSSKNLFLDPTKGGENFLVTGHLCIGHRCC